VNELYLEIHRHKTTLNLRPLCWPAYVRAWCNKRELGAEPRRKRVFRSGWTATYSRVDKSASRQRSLWMRNTTAHPIVPRIGSNPLPLITWYKVNNH